MRKSRLFLVILVIGAGVVAYFWISGERPAPSPRIPGRRGGAAAPVGQAAIGRPAEPEKAKPKPIELTPVAMKEINFDGKRFIQMETPSSDCVSSPGAANASRLSTSRPARNSPTSMVFSRSTRRARATFAVTFAAPGSR